MLSWRTPNFVCGFIQSGLLSQYTVVTRNFVTFEKLDPINYYTNFVLERNTMSQDSGHVCHLSTNNVVIQIFSPSSTTFVLRFWILCTVTKI